MKKAEVILKKAALFERLALYGNRKEFLKALAQDPTQWSAQFKQLLNYAKETIRQMDPALKSSNPNDAKMATLLIENANNIDDIGKAIPYMKKVIPWMQGPNNFEKVYAQVKGNWTLPEVPEVKETPVTMPAGHATKPIPTTKPQRESIRQTFDALKNATETNNLQQAFTYIPKVETLLQQMTDAVTQNPENQTIRQLIQEGQDILIRARQRLGLGGTQTILPEENIPEFNVSETW